MRRGDVLSVPLTARFASCLVSQYERGFYSEECNNTRMLFDRGGVETLPDCFPNEPTEGINTTVPWELEDTFGMMQEDYWREKW